MYCKLRSKFPGPDRLGLTILSARPGQEIKNTAYDIRTVGGAQINGAESDLVIREELRQYLTRVVPC